MDVMYFGMATVAGLLRFKNITSPHQNSAVVFLAKVFADSHTIRLQMLTLFAYTGGFRWSPLS
jgi:hypothetical protein